MIPQVGPVHCPFCRNFCSVVDIHRATIYRVTCSTCGEYEADRLVFSVPPAENLGYLISGATRSASEQGNTLRVNPDKYDQIIAGISIPQNPLEAMELIVLYLSRKSNAVHEYVNIEPSVSYPIAFAKNPNEFVFYVRHLESLAFIETSTQTWGYRLTPKGWERVIELKRVQEDSNQAFVAMWFNEALNPIWENGFKPALEATRFNPLRIDRVEHNQRIDDRIIAEIRRSGLVVADFTGNRGGVYFEAGFAMGLGITVIWTCRTGDIDNVHFDTRQYNHLVWNDATELRDKLVARIEATIPGHLRTT